MDLLSYIESAIANLTNLKKQLSGCRVEPLGDHEPGAFIYHPSPDAADPTPVICEDFAGAVACYYQDRHGAASYNELPEHLRKALLVLAAEHSR